MALVEHVAYCFDTICAATGLTIPNTVTSNNIIKDNNGPSTGSIIRPSSPVYPQPIGLDAKSWTQQFPLFVSWHKKDNADAKSYRLRGCIGCFSPLELTSGLRDYAVKSALEDTRFSPVTAREVPLLECQVSLLLNFTPAKDCYDWTVGTHGVRIEFTSGGRRYGSTYLPEIASEQGWTKEKTIQSLISKSGYSKTINKSLLDSIKLTRYESRTAHLTWLEYVAHRTPAPAPAKPPSTAIATTMNGHSSPRNGRTTNGATNGHTNGNGTTNGNGNGLSSHGTSNGHSRSSQGNGIIKKPTSSTTTEPATKKRGIGV